MTALVLGPLLRHVGANTATIWVETTEACEVSVLGHTEQTFTVHGHNYALVDVAGLAPASSTPYEVLLDGRKVWPEPGSEFPPSEIHTIAPSGRADVAFGSCRMAPASLESYGVDALSAFAHELKDGTGSRPAVLLMIGDQVYADGPGERMLDFIKGRRDTGTGAREEIADFEEYTELYRLAWVTDPAVRWLFSTVPTLAIFDDHDIRDDWNTSYAWREWIWSQPWWRKRIIGGLGSYWIYQHLGNLPPEERNADPLYRAVREAKDGGRLLDEFAERADKHPETARWSFTHTLGTTRIVVVDSRASRVLEAGRRALLDDAEQEWLETQLTGDVEHLFIATSLPFLLPPTIHHLEAWNERVAARKHNGWGEKLRQGADLEHWAAFGTTFEKVAKAVTEVAEGKRGKPPITVAFLGGDIHYSYLARVKGLPIVQIVCSPFRNPLNFRFKWANRLACIPLGNGVARLVAKTAGTPKPPFKWRLTEGPWFRNAIATVSTSPGGSQVTWRAAVAQNKLRVLRQATVASVPDAEVPAPRQSSDPAVERSTTD